MLENNLQSDGKISLGVYIHIPFCIKKCNYCDFCSYGGKNGEDMEKYCTELCRRIAAFGKTASYYRVDTVYFGGGTPTLLPIECLHSLIECLRASFDISPDAEISAECNPATASLEYFCRMRKMGINRLSIGLQSVHENELKLLGRAHCFEDFKTTYADARRAGFDNISVDLMYGIPEQTTESFWESLETLAKLRPEHISSYGLKIEEGTPFYKMRSNLTLPNEETESEMYFMLSDVLSSHGYKKYEISNFSLDGCESRHNLRYWQGLDYIGFGVGAHSFIEGERFGNSRDIGAFLGGECIECERERICEADRLWEYVILSFRLASGLDTLEFKARSGLDFFDYYKKAKALVADGFMSFDGRHIAFTDKGFLVSNAILSDMPSF